MPRHKHADCIIAWAEGKQIQIQNLDGTWFDFRGTIPQWHEDVNYRVKPEKKKGWINIYRLHESARTHGYGGQIYQDKHDAAPGWPRGRVACIEIEYEEGQGL